MAASSNTDSVALDRDSISHRPLVTSRHFLFLLAACLLIILSWRFAEVRPAVLFRPSTGSAVWTFVRSLFPPDLSRDFLYTLLRAVAQTIATALIGTILSILFGLPLGLLATGTLWNRGLLATNDGVSVGWVASRLARVVLGFLRAVPDLVWALLFVAAVGLGPLAGTLALAVAYTGVLGRVYADVFEHVDPLPLEALHSTGATRMQIFLRGIWPQAVPNLTAYTLYSFECCIRAAAVLGFVGAGGIGYEISISMRLFQYGQVLTLLMVFILLLAMSDAASRYLRNRSIKSGMIDHEVRTQSMFSRQSFPATFRKLSGWTSVLLVLAVSFALAGFAPGTAIQTGLADRLVRFVQHMLPPDFSWSFISTLGTALLQTIGISLIGTLIGMVFATILSVPATSTLTFVRRDSPGRHDIAQRSFRWIIFWGARLSLNVLRSIPELVWVLICILAVGIGPFAGTIALGLHTAGVLGKLYAETMEEVPARPVEALRSLGARPIQLLLWAIWPQARPLLSSYTVLRWETNLRASTIVGLVGGGGLGQAIYNNVQLGFYPRLTTLILLIYALVIASDWVGGRIRLSLA